MQLIEYFLWKYQPCEEPVITLNEDVTKIGAVVNHLEPIVLWLAILKFGEKLPDWVQKWMGAFVVITVIYTKRVLDTSECTTVTEESAPHLQWKWNNEKYGDVYYLYFLVTLLILFGYGISGHNGRINMVLGLGSFVISLLIYGRKKVVGAMWCWLAALMPYALLLLYK
jgi:hypothetical protein